jgi:nucleoside-diphosphate-sugar epimerase
MKILITGAAGFIGKFVVEEALKRGHQVVALVRSAPPMHWKGVQSLETLQCDLAQVRDLDLHDRGIDVVLHLAAATKGSEAEQFQDTVTGTSNLLNAARQAGIRRVIGISSMAVLDYRIVRPLTVIDERIGVAPRSARMGAYAAAKLRQEDLFSQFGLEEHSSCVILRPGLVYDESRLIAAHAGIIKGPVGLLASHQGEVPTIAVGSLARAIANAAERSPPGGGVLHLVDDQLPSQREYLTVLRRRGVLPRVNVVVPWRVLRGLCGLLRVVLTVTGFGGNIPEALSPHGFAARLKPFRFSNAKAKALLGWTPGSEFA